MELPRILLIGKIGQVGWELRRTLAPMARVTCVDFPEIDLTSGDSIRQWVRETRPSIVINAAAYTAVDKAESEPDKAMKINGVAPGILAEEAKKLGALLVHYSTDYVFDGTKTEPYVETDTPNPLGAYGRTKLAGRRGGAGRRRRASDLPALLGLWRARAEFHAHHDAPGARAREAARGGRPGRLPDVVADDRRDDGAGAEAGCRCAAISAHSPALTISRHRASPVGMASREAIVKLMPAEGRKCSQVEAITTAEYPTPTKRPAYSVLACDKLERTFGLRLPHWEESLKQVLET